MTSKLCFACQTEIALLDPTVRYLKCELPDPQPRTVTLYCHLECLSTRQSASLCSVQPAVEAVVTPQPAAAAAPKCYLHHEHIGSPGTIYLFRR